MSSIQRGGIDFPFCKGIEMFPSYNTSNNVPLIDTSQHSKMMSTGNKNWYPHLSYQGTPTLQLHHVSYDAVDNNVINHDVQIIDNINLDFWNERPPKKRRLMPPWVEVMES